jgi:hypothetical protein
MTKAHRGTWTTLVLALVVAACAACVPLGGGVSSESRPTAQDLVVEAVAEALPDATTILASVSQSGSDQGWALEIDYPAVPLTPDVLSAALIAAAEADPSAVEVRLYFFEAGTDNPLPIREAADELGIPWTPIGSGGGWLAGQIPDIHQE